MTDQVRGPADAAARQVATRPLPGRDRPAPAHTCPTDAHHPAAKKYRDLFELAAATRNPATLWLPGRPLSDARNAHRTNTREEFEHALEAGYNFFEGDVSSELNPPHGLEMRHDEMHESGDNLTLAEWLDLGKASGRGLKLDIKDGERTGEVLDAIARAGVPDERLMLNLGFDAMARWGDEIRQRFPHAILAINPPSKLGGQEARDGKLRDLQVAAMVDQAKRFGPPATFVVRYDRLTDQAIGKFKAVGAVSVWNSPSQGGVKDVAALTRKLRVRGVDGVIDLRKSMGTLDKARAGLGLARNAVRTFFGKLS